MFAIECINVSALDFQVGRQHVDLEIMMNQKYGNLYQVIDISI